MNGGSDSLDLRVGRALVLFAAAFVLSRTVLWACGLHYSTEHVGAIMHFPPLDLLRDRLGETLWYLHGQPPLPSLVLGLCLQWGGAAWPTVLATLSHALAAAAGGAMVVVLRRTGRSTTTSVAIATAFSLLPGVLVYEHYAFTTMPVLALLLLACVPLQRAIATGQARSWFLFLLLTALVVNTRHVFHLVWWLGGLALLPRCGRLPWRRSILIAALPAALAVMPFAKNALVHGTLASSTWMGFGLARKTWHQELLEVRQQRALAGTAAAITAVPVFGSVAEFALAVPMPPPSGVPLLDRREKDPGVPNYHHAIYIAASSRMRDEALAEVWRNPGPYCSNVATTFGQCFLPSTAWGPVATPVAQLGRWRVAIDFLLHAPLPGTPVNAWLLLTALAAGCGLIALRSLRRHAEPDRASRDVVALFAVGTTIYVIVVAVLFDTNEVMRLRQKVDGLIVLAVALAGRRARAIACPAPAAR